MNDVKLAHFLGWASLAIAGVEILGQGYVERELLGIDAHPQLMPALGVREAAAGITILSSPRASPTLAAGLWSRVGGDAMDLALLAVAAPKTRKPVSFAANALTVLGITALDIFCATKIQRKLTAQGTYERGHVEGVPKQQLRGRFAMRRMTAGL